VSLYIYIGGNLYHLLVGDAILRKELLPKPFGVRRESPRNEERPIKPPIGKHVYERLLDKTIVPNETEITDFLGPQSHKRLAALEDRLGERYRLSRELKFPFGRDYGWSYKYSHGSFHLCYVFFERGSFTVTLQIGDKLVPSLEEIISSMLLKTQDLWKNRYPCGEHGGWIHYRVLNDEELTDVVQLIAIRKKPSS